MARDYELGIIINPEVGDEQARAIVERVAQIVTNNNGQVVRVNAWGRRRLAYPINRLRDGLYFFYDLMLEPSSIAEIERNIRVNEDIVRHLMKLRDSRVVALQRQREAELEVQQAQAAAEAAARAEAAAQAAAEAAATEAATATEEAAEAPTAEAVETVATSESSESTGDEPEAVKTSDAEA